LGFFAITLYNSRVGSCAKQAERGNHVEIRPVAGVVSNRVQFVANARYRPETLAAARWYRLIYTFNLSQTERYLKQRLISRRTRPAWLTELSQQSGENAPALRRFRKTLRQPDG
jgi:hypothetical protein